MAPGLGRSLRGFLPTHWSPALTLPWVADSGCFANKGDVEAFCHLVIYLSQGSSGWRAQSLSLTLPFQQVCYPQLLREERSPARGDPHVPTA